MEAQRLMNYLAEFLTEQPLTSPVLTDPFQVRKDALKFLLCTAVLCQRFHLDFSNLQILLKSLELAVCEISQIK